MSAQPSQIFQAQRKIRISFITRQERTHKTRIFTRTNAHAFLRRNKTRITFAILQEI